jgi:hypothetical protein
MLEFVGVTLAIVTGMVAAHPAIGGVAYLASVGPAPLRFEMATSGMPLAWKPLRLELSPEGNAGVSTPAVETTASATNVPVLEIISSAVTNTLTKVSTPAADSGAKKNLEKSPDTVVFPVLPGDSSIPVTPQMLSVFFKPVPGGKNPAAIAVAASLGIGFTPPSPKVAAESRATYKIE